MLRQSLLRREQLVQHIRHVAPGATLGFHAGAGGWREAELLEMLCSPAKHCSSARQRHDKIGNVAHSNECHVMCSGGKLPCQSLLNGATEKH